MSSRKPTAIAPQSHSSTSCKVSMNLRLVSLFIYAPSFLPRSAMCAVMLMITMNSSSTTPVA